MLATNQKMYQEVLSLDQQKKADGSVDWAKVFEDSSLYKQIYKQEIIVAVMEESNEGESKRVMFVEEQKIAAAYGTNYTTSHTISKGDDGDNEETKDDTKAFSATS